MATYTVAAGQVGAHAKQLAANTADQVTFAVGTADTPGWGNVPRLVEVLTDGAADIYVTVDGSTPTVGGGNCYRVPAAAGASTFPVVSAGDGSPVVVRLVSAGTPVYSVSRAG